eukprot:4300471-Pyramimonas_sp.AAC.1
MANDGIQGAPSMNPWRTRGFDPWAAGAAELPSAGGAIMWAAGPSQSAVPPQAACPAAAWAPADGADHV